MISELLAQIGLQQGWVALGGRGIAGEGLGAQRGGVDIADELLGAVEIQLGREGPAHAVVPSRGGGAWGARKKEWKTIREILTAATEPWAPLWVPSRALFPPASPRNPFCLGTAE